MSSERSPLVFSIFIDRTGSCSDAESCLARSLDHPIYKDGLDRRQLEDFGPFKAVDFYLDRNGGLPIKQANLLASAYKDGH